MNNITKNALEESLKKFLLQKPLDKITISDLTTDCGISRMAFYYHFKDIYDLVEWACIEDASRALQGKKTYDTWQEGLLQIFEAVLENKPFILNVYRSVSRERVENYLYTLTYQLIEGVVEEHYGYRSAEEVYSRLLQIQLCRRYAGLDQTWNERIPGRNGRFDYCDDARKCGEFFAEYGEK